MSPETFFHTSGFPLATFLKIDGKSAKNNGVVKKNWTFLFVRVSPANVFAENKALLLDKEFKCHYRSIPEALQIGLEVL